MDIQTVQGDLMEPTLPSQPAKGKPMTHVEDLAYICDIPTMTARYDITRPTTILQRNG